MGLAQFNTPTLTDKRLFLMSDTQSRVAVIGPNAQTAFNLQLRSFDQFTRTADDAMYTDPETGFLRLPDANLPRFEVNGLIVEPTPLLQYVRETQNFINNTVWTQLNSPVISSQTQVGPTGIGNTADVLSGGNGDGLAQIMVGLDPVSTDYRLSVFLKPLPPATVPQVELFVNFSGSTPDPAITETIIVDPTTDWLRYDLNALNANAAHNVAEIRLTLKSTGDIAIYGANFTESDYLASYRPRVLEPLATTGEEDLVYPIEAMGIEPTLTTAFTIIWEFIPLGEQGRQAPQIAFAGGDSAGPTPPPPPTLYDKVLAFGAHPSVVTDFRLAVTDSTSGIPVAHTHTGTYNWARYSHQKWAFVIFNDGSQKCRFFANGAFLGETIITPVLTADNYTKFVLPVSAIHRRIETLAEALDDSAAIAATTL